MEVAANEFVVEELKFPAPLLIRVVIVPVPASTVPSIISGVPSPVTSATANPFLTVVPEPTD